MEPIEILEKLVTLFKTTGGKAPTAAELLASLPAEAISNRIEGVADWKAELSGYKAGHVIYAAIERLGPGGWSDVAIYGAPLDAYLTKHAREKQEPDGVLVNCLLVIYFPALNKGTITAGTGDGATLADAQKAARTTALKRALAEVGIGIRGYMGDLSDERGKGPRPEDIPGKGPVPPPPVKSTSTPAPNPPARTAPPAAPAKAGGPSAAQVTRIGLECKDAGFSVEDLEAHDGRPISSMTISEASALIGALIAKKHPLQAAGKEENPYG